MLFYFIEIECVTNVNGVLIYQRKYANAILKKFSMNACNNIANPS